MTHKLTLENPPDGFEAAVEWRLPIKGDMYLGDDGRALPAMLSIYNVPIIILTPKKKPFWRLDPVATFEEATHGKRMTRPMGLASSLHGDEPMTYWASADCEDVKWWRWTICEE